MNEKNNNFFAIWAIMTGILQIMDYDMNVHQTSNDVILQELQNQNKKYLEKIVKQNEEILHYLTKLK